jgi:hypothetical protein
VKAQLAIFLDGTMAHYDIFRHHLAIKFPAYGHALWDPDPGSLYPAVEVGDVGYIREGKFHRLFNVLLPAIIRPIATSVFQSTTNS